jgi:ribosomal protein S12 methylthiotransferase
MYKIALINLGCNKNQIDGENILSFLTDSGFEYTNNLLSAEIIIVNTCAFIREAQIEAINAILEASEYKKKAKCKILAVAGCFSQRFKKEAMIELPEVDLWLSISNWQKELINFLKIKSRKKQQNKRVLFPPFHTQYLKISEGCSRRCSFCIIPYIKGNLKSRSPNELIKESLWLYSKGVKELILVSQDTTSYGKDINYSLIKLLELLLKNTKFPWIRLMYLHPQAVSLDLIKLIASEKRLLPYFDIPLQHINDEILISMRRRPLSRGIYQLIDNIRKFVPDAAIRTTFIVGYPKETNKIFCELLDFIEKTRIEHIGVFPFSPEKGTPAYLLPKKPKNNTVSKRCYELISLAREISKSFYQSKIGKQISIIVDDNLKQDLSIITPADKNLNNIFYEGRTIWDAPEVDGKTIIPAKVKIGNIINVKVISSSDYELTGVPVIN